MENIKNYFSNNKNFVITLLICVILTSSIMFLSYKNISMPSSGEFENILFEDTTIHEFQPYITKLSKINTSLNKCINGVTINSKDASTILNENIKDLKELKEEISSLVIANNKNPEIIPKLLLCIESTENLYNYCINVLSYTNNLSTAEITSEILLLKENCSKSYEDLSNYGFSLSLPEESETFIDNLIGYLNTIEKLNKEDEIKTSQYNSYIENLSKTTHDFSVLLEDLEPAIKQIRKENRSLDVILNDISEKQTTLETIKKEFNYSSIPDGCISYYNCFNNTFTLYSTYLDTLKIAVIYEKSSSSYEDNKENIDKNYHNAFSKYDDVKTSFESLLNSF